MNRRKAFGEGACMNTSKRLAAQRRKEGRIIQQQDKELQPQTQRQMVAANLKDLQHTLTMAISNVQEIASSDPDLSDKSAYDLIKAISRLNLNVDYFIKELMIL